MEIKRDELFHFVRWVNLFLGLLSAYYYLMGASTPLLSIGFLNITVWTFTRKVKIKNV